MKKAQVLQQRLQDNRSKKVVFVSHCLLNENVRYLGGACRKGCVREVVEWCMDNDLGIVQMPCPEQKTWGGVTKRWLLMGYGAKGTFLYQMRRLFLPLFLQYTKLIYRQLAKTVVDQINDYLVSGYSIIGVIGIDPSPSCGVNTTSDFERSFEWIASIDVESVTVEQINNLIRQGLTDGSLTDGRGLFTIALQKELNKRHIDLCYVAHDLIAEINGKNSNVGTLLS